MSNSEPLPTHIGIGLGLHGENEDVAAPGNGVPPINPDTPQAVNPIDVSSCVAIRGDLGADPKNSIPRDVRAAK